MKRSDSSEYTNFERMVGELLKVPHSEIKAKLDAERKAKKRRPRREKKAP